LKKSVVIFFKNKGDEAYEEDYTLLLINIEGRGKDGF
jgi:hypothetical protein